MLPYSVRTWMDYWISLMEVRWFEVITFEKKKSQTKRYCFTYYHGKKQCILLTTMCIKSLIVFLCAIVKLYTINEPYCSTGWQVPLLPCTHFDHHAAQIQIIHHWNSPSAPFPPVWGKFHVKLVTTHFQKLEPNWISRTARSSFIPTWLVIHFIESNVDEVFRIYKQNAYNKFYLHPQPGWGDKADTWGCSNDWPQLGHIPAGGLTRTSPHQHYTEHTRNTKHKI